MTLYEIGRKIYPNSLRKRVRFAFKSRLMGKRIVYEIEDLFGNPKLQKIILANPKQYEKVFRPYLFATLQLESRMSFVRAHYEFTAQNWSDNLIKAVYVDRYFELASIKIVDDEINIALSRESTFANEGEIYVFVGSKKNGNIFSLNFNFTKEDCGSGILIGCMQGASSESAREMVRELTKDMQGLRPHHLLLFVLQKIAEFYALCRIKAITTEGHVYNADNKGARIKTDYNGFWEEAGGNKLDDNFYQLPLVDERKSMEEIKSNKRAMYRRRFEMMDDIAEQIKTTLSKA